MDNEELEEKRSDRGKVRRREGYSCSQHVTSSNVYR